MKSLLKIASIIILLISTIYSQALTGNILLGQTLSIDSKILNEKREIFVYTPDGYFNSEESFPVLYVLDGETNFFIASAIADYLVLNQRIPRMLVVGIPNVARNRDFTPIPSNTLQNSGGGDNFISFMENEVIPIVDKSYRTQNYKILFGHSLCGMFSIYSLFNNPSLFNSYIAASPYLMFEDEFVIDNLEDNLDKIINNKNKLFISIGDEQAYFQSLERISKIFNDNENKIDWTQKKYLDEDHGSVPFRTISDGLGFIFSEWSLSMETAMKGLDAVKAHYQNRLNKYGFTTKITEAALNQIGYQLLQRNKNEKAIEVFEYNVKLYPESANVYDSLGDGYDANSNKKKALINYKKAVKIAEDTNNPNLQIFRNNRDRLK